MNTNQSDVAGTAISLMSNEQLRKLVRSQAETIEQQKRVLQTLRVKDRRQESELQGSKVVISMLVQSLGGRVSLTNQELQEHVFDLKINYNIEKSSTIFISKPKPKIKDYEKTVVELKRTDVKN